MAKETKIAKIRNLMSPLVAFFEMDELIVSQTDANKIAELIKFKSKSERQAKKNMKELVKLIKSDDIYKDPDVAQTFELSKAKYAKYEKWRKKLPDRYFGCSGGGFEFVFIPTGIGTITEVRSGEHKLDLTEEGDIG